MTSSTCAGCTSCDCRSSISHSPCFRQRRERRFGDEVRAVRLGGTEPYVHARAPLPRPLPAVRSPSAESARRTGRRARSGSRRARPVIADLYMPVINSIERRHSSTVTSGGRPSMIALQEVVDHRDVQVLRFVREQALCVGRARLAAPAGSIDAKRNGVARRVVASPVETACSRSPKISRRLRLSWALTVTTICPMRAVAKANGGCGRIFDLDVSLTVAASAMSDAGSPMNQRACRCCGCRVPS